MSYHENIEITIQNVFSLVFSPKCFYGKLAVKRLLSWQFGW